jgi:hypothetical protein
MASMASFGQDKQIEKEEIIQISYVGYGGEFGWYSSFIITKDSIYYYENIAAYKKQGKKYAAATSAELWEELLKACNLNTFAQIKSGKSLLYIDGSDQTFTVETNKRKLSFTNGHEMGFRKLKDFFQLVDNQLYKCRKAADKLNNTLNEKWYNKTFPSDDANQMNRGTDCYFYEDGTFEINLWDYHASIGNIRCLITGKYQYDWIKMEISLLFDDDFADDFRKIPIACYTMRGLQEGGLPALEVGEKDFPVYSKSCLKIVKELGENKIQVDLSAYKENGEEVSCGQVKFTRESIDETENE